jgi:hypothetical protein
MSVLTTIENLNFNSLKLAKVGRVIKLISDKQQFNLKTGSLYMPFNVSKFKKQWSNFEEYSVDCYVDSSLNEPVKFTELNDKIFSLVKENTQLFNNIDIEILTNSPFYRDNKTFPKLLKLQLPRDNNGNFTTQFFDENGEIIIIDENNIETILNKKTTFKAILTCSKVWVYGNKVGSIWNVLQIKLTKNNQEKNEELSDELSDESVKSDNEKSKYNNIYTQHSLID